MSKQKGTWKDHCPSPFTELALSFYSTLKIRTQQREDRKENRKEEGEGVREEKKKVFCRCGQWAIQLSFLTPVYFACLTTEAKKNQIVTI